MSGTIETAVAGHVATVVFDNPGQRNALTPEMLAALGRELEGLAGRDAVRVVVLRGAGDVFSSGYAIDRIPAGADLPERDEIDAACEVIERSPLVVIAMVRAYAVGAALDVASACDFRFAEQGARLGITPVKLGLVYGWRGTSRILRLVGRDAARRLFLSGDLVTAADARTMGLLSDVFPDGEALERETYRFAERIGTRAPLALAGTKRVLHALEHVAALPPDVTAELLGLRRAALDSRDVGEARAAFADKREPRFTGR
jgi:enoyl-CoA hydratase/carnithine racemase